MRGAPRRFMTSWIFEGLNNSKISKVVESEGTQSWGYVFECDYADAEWAAARARELLGPGIATVAFVAEKASGLRGLLSPSGRPGVRAYTLRPVSISPATTSISPCRS